MKRSFLQITLVALLTCCVAPLATAQQPVQPGNFYFYLFTISWSPQFCATTHTHSVECSTPQGNFVVHGLWPEFKNGSWPQNCSREPGPSDPSAEADVMPDPSLVEHEWQKHGTCSGLGVDGYFGLIRSTKKSITIPDLFLHLDKATQMVPADIKARFVAVNTQMKAEDIVIGCANNSLVEVQVCLAKDGTATSCGAIKDCRASKIKVLPVLH